jgi:hypothetical protein
MRIRIKEVDDLIPQSVPTLSRDHKIPHSAFRIKKSHPVKRNGSCINFFPYQEGMMRNRIVYSLTNLQLCIGKQRRLIADDVAGEKYAGFPIPGSADVFHHDTA